MPIHQTARTFGARRVPTATTASGCWQLGEVTQASRDGIWPTEGDPFFLDVVLLLQDNATDSSLQGQTVTSTGTATVSGTETKFGTSSFLTNGTANRFEVTYDASLAMPADFTAESWVFFDSYANNELFRILRTNTTGNTKPQFSVLSDTLYFDVFGSQLARSGALSLSSGTWYHMAASRQGSALKLFLDGTEVASGTTSISFAADKYLLPHSFTSSRQLYFDDFRLTVGTSRYNANFTPPTEPFTSS